MKKICIKTILLLAAVLLSNPSDDTIGNTTPPIKNGGGPFLPSYVTPFTIN
jgi:hypothetical protein